MSSDNQSILCISFNQDYSCFALGTTRGFCVFGIEQTRLRERFKRNFNGGVGIIELLYKSNLVALVGGGPQPVFPPTKLIIWDDYQNKGIAELEYDSPVRAARLKRDIIVVVVDTSVFVYDFRNLNLRQTFKTCPNPRGLIAVSSSDKKIIAYPSTEDGKVIVSNLETGASASIEAHKHIISAMSLSPEANLLVTASSEGTLFRVWDTARGEKVGEFRRGKNAAEIYSISFSQDGKFIVTNSNRGTIHLYTLQQDGDVANKESKFSKIVPGFSGVYGCCEFSITPEVYTSVFFGWQNSPSMSVMAITQEGSFMKFNITTDKGKMTMVQDESSPIL
ncbi:WD repeat domain phosphoinositide-interacting protein, putative [Entamoeba invadens IP1]|uniref:WD repeat domain phosphoinositide-interacting protein, putative n=2 Tax=Entamoeba invadens TaxID=33085 RepID=A0A0A1UG16_ENTIV|nr:WD repeat domain phosphoinositide-interacting protein, putative [Entamoeba invadens IP1]ELP92139.1 WD repeat domain phosphoinositide-interacting protein, putative [Entamoeba invadens IP1]BAN40686.1 WD repeat domain phosphoinositide-interacting protein, putative [Entamoeba invadens]BAN40879.1 WD repeat domain phosphoinositide-interacting protein, putative [Entamoeba invadens]|eukprot:XP_004258910.1 WD repeat domain phosphoinositide-interacting protein, putative [Entamoeba invadens IP1]